MPTNDERREVAARIRALREHAWDESSVFDLLGCAVEECGLDDTDQLFAHLADLIEPEERTCRDECGGELDFHCSECGCHLYLISIENEPSLVLGEAVIQPSFCPNCGAKVVE